jgi:uncharacterized coiled-coil protein SlyX
MASLLLVTQAALNYTAVATEPKPLAVTKLGKAALKGNTGNANTAVGFHALDPNVACTGAGTPNACCTDIGKGKCGNGGSNNTALGSNALISNIGGGGNTALGTNTLTSNTTGSDNIAVGNGAGSGITTANHMIAIGVPAAGPFAALNNTCFIGSIFGQPVSDAGSAQDIYVDKFNVVGFLPSSQRYKHDIKPMSKASEVLYGLKPVTFKYKTDPAGAGPQYGLIAEDVAEVNPDLVVHGKAGIETVRYEQINAMVLNEFLKEHKKVEEQQANIAELKSTVAQQQKGMEVLTAQLKELTAQIQKVSCGGLARHATGS